MSYTSTDLASIRAALMKLAEGERVVRVTLEDGETVQYGLSDMSELRSLESRIDRIVNSRKRYRHIVIDKGL